MKVKKILLVLTLLLCLQFSIVQAVQAAPSVTVKELNFVFLHGMGGNPCAFQSVQDQMNDMLPYFIDQYQEAHPGIDIKVNMMARCYPGYMSIEAWAQNIADSINTHFAGKDNLILICHSMGGKTALYTVAHNIDGIGDKTAAVITINSPIKKLDNFYVPGGGPMVDYCRTVLLGSDQGVCESLATYDSSADGLKISQEKHWLAFVSAESSPLSPDFNRSGVDVWPRNMDDGVVPLTAQFAEGADIIYYGHHQHSDAGVIDEISKNLSNYIMQYIFGYPIEFSIPAREGTINHEADWLLGTDLWTDIVGGVETANGTITHKNTSFYKWVEWQDIIGAQYPEDERSYTHIHLGSTPLISNIRSATWVSDNLSDGRLNVVTSAAPLTNLLVDWKLFSAGILPEENPRSFYDIEITNGTPLATITDINWWKDDPLNPVIFVQSQAQSPFRWFDASWRTYTKESRTVTVIDDIPALSGN